MESPLLSPTAETCGTSETYQTMLPLPPPPDPNETNWIVPINESLKRMPIDGEQQYWKNPSIYRVPASITNLNPKAYQPQVVSFGPYHHDEVHLRPMEEHKRRALVQFLKRSGNSLEPFRESLREVAHKLEDSYDALDLKRKEGTGDQFLELMIRDSCFMLEIMRATRKEEKHDYADNDPIFSTHRLTYITPYIRRDMLMLENQLPMLGLYQLVAVENNGKEVRDEYINELILRFYSLDMGITAMGTCLHVMDVFRKGLLIEPRKVQHELENAGPEAGEEIIWSATELNEAGIQFKKSKTSSLKDISFVRGVLSLPVIMVEDATESMFLNVMTFKRLHGAGFEVTSYVNFMHNIIDNEGDVKLLHTGGIIQNAIGSNKAVKLFNSLCKEVTLESNSSLDAMKKNISKYCELPWNIWRANLNRTYFRSPWSIFSLIGAIFFFALTIIQTVYAVLSYI